MTKESVLPDLSASNSAPSVIEICAKAAYNKMMELAAARRGWTDTLPWDALEEEQKHIQRGAVRATIEALRDPTEAMAEAMFNACRDIPRTGVVPEDIERAFDCWRAGIDTALAADGKSVVQEASAQPRSGVANPS